MLIGTSDAAITINQIDDFENATTENWSNGGAPDPVVSLGGPLGAGDHYLQITSDGSGAGGKLTMFNRSQWTGDYNAAGVTQIEMDLKGFNSPGNADLSIRIAFKSGTTQASPGYVSTTPFTLPIDGSWHHASFDLSAMTAANGSPPALSTLLANVPEMRVLDAAAANTVHGDNIAAQIGVDNITAVPEPVSTGISALVLAGFALHRRCRKSRQV